jgi:predicted ATPase
MIRLIEALGYRSLRDVQQELDAFHILVGPNASGKSSFLDVPKLLGSLIENGLSAVQDRSPDIRNLVFLGAAERFEVAIELEIPGTRRDRLSNGYKRARYEVAIGHDPAGVLAILAETLWLKPNELANPLPSQRELFPESRTPRRTIVLPEGKQAPPGWKKVVTKKGDNSTFISETTGWNNPFRLGHRKSALANLPEDEERFPVATWVKRRLAEGVRTLALSSEAMRRPAPPGSPREFQPDGSNLPWAVEGLRRSNEELFSRWIAHVRTALPDLKSVDTVERPEDKFRYLVVEYETGLRAPSWTVSDGTLRLLALTLAGYLDTADRTWLVEEPENGIHPQAVECVYQALSSAVGCQVLLASHSPVLLALPQPKDIICFAKGADGATDIVRGDSHPRLKGWRQEIDVGTLFASGVLG